MTLCDASICLGKDLVTTKVCFRDIVGCSRWMFTAWMCCNLKKMNSSPQSSAQAVGCQTHFKIEILNSVHFATLIEHLHSVIKKPSFLGLFFDI